MVELDNFLPSYSLPYFSIIIPVFNVEKYIARCLESCIKQTFKDIEIIIVDDCGQDQSMQIARNYAQMDHRIQIVNNPKNLGLFHARIIGESFSNGKFIMHVDSDDLIDVCACELIWQALQSEYEQTGTYADICWFASERLYSKKPKVYHPSLIRSINEEVFKNNMMQWEVWGKAYSKSIIQRADEYIRRFFPKDMKLLIGEDVVKLFAINLFAQKSIGLDKILYFYCENPTSITKSRNNSEIALRNAEQLSFVIRFLDYFDNTQEARNNPYYLPIKDRVQKTLNGHKKMWEYQAFIAHRFDNYPFAYLKTYIKSLKIKKDLRRVGIRLLVYFFTFGLIKI